MTVQRISEILRAPAAASLGVDAARQLAREICDAVKDPKMHPTIAMRAARAVVDGKIEAQELTELLDVLVAQRTAGRLRSPGAYFVASLKRVFQRNEIPW